MAVYMLVLRSLEASKAFIENSSGKLNSYKISRQIYKKRVFCKNFLDEKSKLLHHQDRISKGYSLAGDSTEFRAI